ncbi:hypothetical protein [Azospirillum sp. B4]|uniref:hypothetical protein n=1 Tax=Azospirillum sp. B4 TaxID=95605 RepID=UPI00034CB512|nr:hypothetical protein [Azospirillum sp. B4]
MRRWLIGSICFSVQGFGMSAVAATPDTLAQPAISRPSSLAAQTSGQGYEQAVSAHLTLRRALLSQNTEAPYLENALSMNDAQPTLYGKSQIQVWQAMIRARRQITTYQPKVREVFDFGQTLIETGDFNIAWRMANGQTETALGKYLLVWEEQADGGLRLKAEVRNWVAPPVDESAFFVELAAGTPSSPPDTALAAELKSLNERNAAGVKNHDLAMRLSFYANDTLLMPRNSTAKIGMAEIRPYLMAYVENGRGATFDEVRVWTEDCQDLGSGYALEYFRFQVDWRAGDKAGGVSGSGVRLWRRGPDGELKTLREIGTHDYRPS